MVDKHRQPFVYHLGLLGVLAYFVCCADSNSLPGNITVQCDHNCTNADGGYQCYCLTGFRLANNGNCTDIDECNEESHNCPANATCLNTIGSFSCSCRNEDAGKVVNYTGASLLPDHKIGKCDHSCTYKNGGYHCYCPPGYRLLNNTECVDINECKERSNACHFNGTCLNTVGSYLCSCNPGNTGKDGNCTDINKCREEGLSQCDHNCTNTEVGYYCSCLPGYRLINNTKCIDIDECAEESNICHSNATCMNIIGSFSCDCISGYTGDGRNCTDINECLDDGLNECDHNCTNTEASYNCSCLPGYRLVNNTICTDVDECMERSDTCHANATCINMIGSFSCDCNSGYTGDGRNCTDINECLDDGLNQCDHNCTNTEASYNCSCLPGYLLVNNTICTDVDECMERSDTCHANATCINMIGSFSCDCNSGYTGDGRNCTDINECLDYGLNQCDHNCTNTEASYNCSCLPGYLLVNNTICTDVDECMERSDTCHANATCINMIGSFSCDCNSGYTGDGRNCTDINECLDDGLNQCDHNCTNTEVGYICSCLPGYRLVNSTNCTDIDECMERSDVCHANATCMNTIGSFSCECNSGYTGDGENCTDIDECLDDNVNKCDHNCTNTEGGYYCSCVPGYRLVNNTNCIDIDECIEGSDTCHANATCMNAIGTFSCSCNSGYTGDGENCTDINECFEDGLNQCDHNCTNTEAGYNCSCLSGYRLVNSTNCTDIDECMERSDVCHANATCMNTLGSFSCDCNSGYTGDGENCTDINECLDDGLNQCDHNCTNTEASYNCSCLPGYRLANNTSCTDVDECMERSDTCHANATCMNTIGSFSCECNSGYTGDGENCTDIDECLDEGLNKCDHNCTNTEVGYYCSCLSGYRLENNTSCTDIDECIEEFDVCHTNATCMNTIGSFSCECNSGYTGDGENCTAINECLDDGLNQCDHNCTNTEVGYICFCLPGYRLVNSTNCTDIDECMERSDTCHANATCMNTIGSFSCECNSGYTGDGENCTDINECFEDGLNQCDHNCTNTEAGYNCSCLPGYRLVNSTKCIDIDECIESSDACHANATCLNTIGSFSCDCNSGYTGDGENCTDVNECFADGLNQCDHNCTNTEAGYICSCLPGYRLVNSTNCTDIDECKERSDVCHANATCMNTIGSFSCECNSGYTGDGENCTGIDSCLEDGLNQCDHNCTSTDLGYYCSCLPGYRLVNDKYCIDIDECTEGSDTCHANATCTNTIGSFSCDCNSLYTGDGKNCTDINECLDDGFNQCDHNCTNTELGYLCSCLPGYRLVNNTSCMDIDECMEGSGICHVNATCLNTIGSFSCSCTDFVNNCTDVNECLDSAINKCDHNCTNTEEGYQCSCFPGYQLANMTKCIDMDECKVGSHRCHTNATCLNAIGSFSCSCKSGYTGDGESCADTNECLDSRLNNCDHICTNTEASYRCSCLPGYRLLNNRNCIDIDECHKGTHRCHIKAKCFNTIGSFSCVCDRGYTGDGENCQDTNECLAYNLNQCEQNCINTDGGFYCSCLSGYRLKTNRACQDIDECSEGSHRCHAKAACLNTMGSFLCSCNQGYTGNGIQCNDINECLDSNLNQCEHNCTNTEGSYRCFCRSGHRSAGLVSCVDINECREGIHRCHANAACLNTIGSFSCSCITGYTGNGVHCSDINECFDSNLNQCEHICINTEGSYRCFCRSGHRQVNITRCVDINECRDGLHRCHANAVCLNTKGSYYCSCNDGYTGNGWYCKEDRLFAYDCNRMQMNADEGAIHVMVPSRVPIGTQLYKHIYACSNGYFSFGYRICHWSPYFYSWYDVVAPYWSDLDYLSGVGGFSATVHESGATDAISVKIFSQTRAFFAKYTNVRGFIPTTIILGTWCKATPYPSVYYVGRNEFVTFQVNIATNGARTYALFVYDDEGMLWTESWIRPRVGYSVSWEGRRDVYQLILNGYGYLGTYRFDSYVGNTNFKGRWFWKIGEKVNYAAKCYEWYWKQPGWYYLWIMRYHGPSDCPCTYWQAIFDRRFVYSSYHSNMICFKQRATWFFFWSSVSFHTTCCYDSRWLFLISWLYPSMGLATQRHVSVSYPWYYIAYYSYYRSYSRWQAESSDRKAFEYCCQLSPLCHLYYEKRPVPRCWWYRPPWWGFTFGDPHIRTLDGHTYTFNGVGDYLLFSVKNSTKFIIHSRMSKARVSQNASISESKATVFSGFAMKADQGALVEFYLNVTTGSVQILVNKKNYSTSNFTTAQTINDTEITWSTGNKTKLSVAYESGAGAVIDVLSSQLSIQVTSLPEFANRTLGLLGVNNDDISDDLTRPDGTTISINSTQEEIYYQFGMLWNVTGNSSLFSMPDPDFNASFVPGFFDDIDKMFGNNTELKRKSIALCGATNFICLFDYALTGDEQAVTESQSSLQNFEAEKKAVGSFPPTIHGPSSLNVSYQQIFTFQIQASSNTSDAFTYAIETNGTELIVNPTTGNVTWFINNTDFTLTYVVTDSNNNSASLSPTVGLCNCRNGGTCNPAVANIHFESTNNLMIYGDCTCLAGYEGAFCENKTSYCLQYPCFEGVICTDNYTSHTAVCGPCPQGLVGDGSKCYDFDECVNKTAECNQICTNVLGSYNCSCNSGYVLQNRTHCADIDECAQTAHGCHINASCSNNPGSYSCACMNGFTGDGYNCSDVDECNVNTTACHDKAQCSNTIGSFDCMCIPGFSGDGKLNCANDSICASMDSCHLNAFCFNDKGNYSCQCNTGYSGNGTVCTDIDECSTGQDLCHSNANCSNNAGSYSCRCNSGFSGSGTVCTDIDECSAGQDSCHSNATCSNNVGSYSCQCNSGFSGNGTVCTDIDECTSGQHLCDSNATCSNNVGSYSCQCNRGFSGNGWLCLKVNASVSPSSSASSDLVVITTSVITLQPTVFPSSTPEPPTETHALAIGIGAAAGALFLLFLCMVYIIKRNRSNESYSVDKSLKFAVDLKMRARPVDEIMDSDDDENGETKFCYSNEVDIDEI